MYFTDGSAFRGGDASIRPDWTIKKMAMHGKICDQAMIEPDGLAEDEFTELAG